MEILVFLFIFLAAFFKSIADIIRVPEKMNASKWGKFKGNQFVDPHVSWTNKNLVPFPFSFIWAGFSDLWHLCMSLMIFSFFAIPYFFDQTSSWWFVFLMFGAYGFCFEFWLFIWKKD